MVELILVTGAVRSGKSEWAEALAHQSGLAVVYVATAQMDETDAEWQARIRRHQHRRSPDWTTLPVPTRVADTIVAAAPTQCLLIDSLGTWVANCLEENERTWEKTVNTLMTALAQTSSQVILVAEETGWGIVPAYPSGRLFRDRLGSLTRTIAIVANPVYLVVAGYALNIKQLGIPVPMPDA